MSRLKKLHAYILMLWIKVQVRAIRTNIKLASWRLDNIIKKLS